MVRIVISSISLLAISFVLLAGMFRPEVDAVFKGIALAALVAPVLLALENLVRKPVGHATFRRLLSAGALVSLTATAWLSRHLTPAEAVVFMLGVFLYAGFAFFLSSENLIHGIVAVRKK